MKIIIGKKYHPFNDYDFNDFWDYDRNEIINQHINNIKNTDFNELGILIPHTSKKRKEKD